jgi:hypothetical protein
VEEAVVEAVGQVVWRFTRLDKLARAAAGVAVVAAEARAKGVGLSEKERELEMSVKKLTRAEEALESAVTCMACMVGPLYKLNPVETHSLKPAAWFPNPCRL